MTQRRPGTHGKVGPICDTCCYYCTAKLADRNECARRRRRGNSQFPLPPSP